MASEKKPSAYAYLLQRESEKSCEASIAIQVPTTSANQTDVSYNNPSRSRTIIDCYRNDNYTRGSFTANSNDDIVVISSDSLERAANARATNNESQAPPPNYHEIPGVVPSYQGRASGPPPSYDEVVNPNASPPSYQSLFGQVSEARKTSNGLVDLLRQLFLILIGTLGCTMIIGFLLIIPVTMIVVGFFYLNDCRAENIPSFLVIGGVVWIIKNVLNCFNQFKKDSFTANRPPPRRHPISPMSSTTTHSHNTSNNNNNNNNSNSNSNNANSTNVLIVSGQINNNDRDNSSTIHPNANNSNRGQIVQQALVASSIIDDNNNRRINRLSSQTNSRRPRDSHGNPNRVRRPSLIGITSFKCESMLNYFLVVWFLAGCIVVYRIYEPDYDNPQSSAYCHRTVYLYAFWLMTSAFIIMAIILSCLCCLMVSSLMSCSHNR